MKVRNLVSGEIMTEAMLKAEWIKELEYDMEPGDRLSYAKKDYPYKSWLANLLASGDFEEVTD